MKRNFDKILYLRKTAEEKLVSPLFQGGRRRRRIKDWLLGELLDTTYTEIGAELEFVLIKMSNGWSWKTKPYYLSNTTVTQTITLLAYLYPIMFRVEMK